MSFTQKDRQEKMHLIKTYKTYYDARNSVCGRNINDSHETFNKDLVTCERCKRTKEYHGK